MKSRLYIYLCDDARAVRERVFAEGAGFDTGSDEKDDMSLHIVVYGNDGTPIGTGRMFAAQPGAYTIGKVAVDRSMRGKGVGLYIVERLFAESVKCGANSITLWAQEHTVPFYERAGFESTGDTMTEDNILHMKMMRYI